MDECVGLPKEHPESYHSFMHNNFFKPYGHSRKNINILNGNAEGIWWPSASATKTRSSPTARSTCSWAASAMMVTSPSTNRPLPGFLHPGQDPDRRHPHRQAPALAATWSRCPSWPDRGCRHPDGRRRDPDPGGRSVTPRPRPCRPPGGQRQPHVDHLHPATASERDCGVHETFHHGLKVKTVPLLPATGNRQYQAV